MHRSASFENERARSAFRREQRRGRVVGEICVASGLALLLSVLGTAQLSAQSAPGGGAATVTSVLIDVATGGVLTTPDGAVNIAVPAGQAA